MKVFKTNKQIRFEKTVLIVLNATADTIGANCCGIFRYKEGVIKSLETETVFIIGCFCNESFWRYSVGILLIYASQGTAKEWIHKHWTAN